MNRENTVPQRRYDLDWLRVLAVFLLVPFHTALIFSLDPDLIVYVKDHIESPALLMLAGFINIWHMPLLFVIAGASTWFALDRRSAGQYLGERVSRLLIPAIFGLLVLIPPMTYLHTIGHPGKPSFWQFYLGFFHFNPNDLTGYRGSFTPAHLWFIIFLFVFSLAALPLFIWLKKPSSESLRAALGRFFSHRGNLLLAFIPLSLAGAVPLLGDKNPLHYLLLFVLGFLLFCDDRIKNAMDRDWPLYALLSALGVLAYALTNNPFSSPWSPDWIVSGLVFQFSRWASVITFLGAAHRWLNFGSPFLNYTSKAAFPFYSLHLPVDTLIGIWVIRLALPVWLKFALIVLLTTLATLAIYEFFIRRIPILRFFFGVKHRRAMTSTKPLSSTVSVR